MSSPDAKARRRKSLAHAMKLVDSAIANLEGVALTPSSATSPSSHRRRRTSGNPLFAADESVPGAAGILARLARQCEAGDGASVSAEDVLTIRAALQERLASKSRATVEVSGFSAEVLAADLAGPSAPTVANLRSWGFDVFAAAEAHPTEVMATVGFALYQDAGLVEHFQLDPAKLVKFLAEVERGYLPTNSYHNHLHGLDVGQSMHFFLAAAGLGAAMLPTERLAALTAALVHDMGHWGLNNGWLVATEDPLALMYNNTSPLESMHVSKALQLLATPGCDVLSGLEALPQADLRAVKGLMVDMVLATDMANHGRDLGALKGKLEGLEDGAHWELSTEPSAAPDRALALKASLPPITPSPVHNHHSNISFFPFFLRLGPGGVKVPRPAFCFLQCGLLGFTAMSFVGVEPLLATL